MSIKTLKLTPAQMRALTILHLENNMTLTRARTAAVFDTFGEVFIDLPAYQALQALGLCRLDYEDAKAGADCTYIAITELGQSVFEELSIRLSPSEKEALTLLLRYNVLAIDSIPAINNYNSTPWASFTPGKTAYTKLQNRGFCKKETVLIAINSDTWKKCEVYTYTILGRNIFKKCFPFHAVLESYKNGPIVIRYSTEVAKSVSLNVV